MTMKIVENDDTHPQGMSSDQTELRESARLAGRLNTILGDRSELPISGKTSRDGRMTIVRTPEGFKITGKLHHPLRAFYTEEALISSDGEILTVTQETVVPSRGRGPFRNIRRPNGGVSTKAITDPQMKKEIIEGMITFAEQNQKEEQPSVA